MNKLLADAPETYTGYASDEQIRYLGSSGGVTTAIIKHLFESKKIGTCLSFRFDQKSCRYVPLLIHSFTEYSICGSIYQDIDIIGFIREHIHDITGCMLVTCAPCQVKAVRSILSRAHIECFVVSFVCSGQTTIDGIYKYYQMLGVDKSQVMGMRYRGKGWPSGIEITLSDGRIIKKDNYTEPWVTMHRSHFWRPKRCFYCQQVYSKDADFAVGDPWLKEFIGKDHIGNTIFTVNTPQGKEILQDMIDEKALNVSSISFEKFHLSQAPGFKVKTHVKENRWRLDKEYALLNNKLYRLLFSRNASTIRAHRLILRIYLKLFRMNIFARVLNKLKWGGIKLYYKNKLGAMGSGWNKGSGVLLNNPQCLFFGKNVGIGSDTFFGPVNQYAGKSYAPKIIIGDGTWIGKHCSLAAIDRVEIGKHVLFAGYVHITDHSHGYEDITQPIAAQPLISKGPVVIEDDCWLGFSCEILSGVHIGKHSIVAARAVVTKDVPPYSIVAGNPARVVKQYNFETNTWEKVK